MNTRREHALALDAADLLAPLRDQFVLPPGTIYLNGNSLSMCPKTTAARVQQDVADISHTVEENIAGVRTIRSFGREEDEVRKMERLAERTFRDSMEAARLRTIYTPLFFWLPSISQRRNTKPFGAGL